MKKFERDLTLLLDRLNKGVKEDVEKKMCNLKDRLVYLYNKNMVKINHSVMELICAKHLILRGYDVSVEYPLGEGLTCDLYGIKGYGTLIVEIETGFIPPSHALDPLTYSRARIASKIARYGNYSNKFGLGTPPHYIMQIPRILTVPPRYRSDKDLKEINKLCDFYYSHPKVCIEEIKNTRIHTIYIIDVDELAVQENDPEAYIERFFR